MNPTTGTAAESGPYPVVFSDPLADLSPGTAAAPGRILKRVGDNPLHLSVASVGNER